MITQENPGSVIERQLGRDERLLWAGQPRGGIRLRPSDAFVIPFSILWCSFAIFWEVSVSTTRAPFFFKLWGIPFVLAGLYFVFGRFIVDALSRARTFYGLTNQRVIICRGFPSAEVKSLPLRTLGEVSLTERPDGSGTIMFGPGHPMMTRAPAGWPGASRYAPPCFEMIDHAKEIYDLLQQTQKEALG